MIIYIYSYIIISINPSGYTAHSIILYSLISWMWHFVFQISLTFESVMSDWFGRCLDGNANLSGRLFLFKNMIHLTSSCLLAKHFQDLWRTYRNIKRKKNGLHLKFIIQYVELGHFTCAIWNTSSNASSDIKFKWIIKTTYHLSLLAKIF